MKREDFTLVVESMEDCGEHFHQDIELLFVLEGQADICTENREVNLKTGDIYVINPNVKHSVKTSGDALMMCLMVRCQIIANKTGWEEIRFWCDSTSSQDKDYDELRSMLRDVLRHYVGDWDYVRSFGFLSDCYKILHYLTVHFVPQPVEVKLTDGNDRYEERIRQINNYIYQNFSRPISMKELSEKLYLSNGYLSRFFKKNYGMSFAQYLTQVRLYRAADDLLYTEEPITRIAYNNGFTSGALFNKVFKKAYGQTPSEFRKAVLEKGAQAEKHTLQEKRLEKVLRSDQNKKENDQELPETASEFDVRIYDRLKNSWGNIINFGDASNLLHSSVREHLLILRQAFGFEYVRFHSLFTEEFYIRPNQEEFNFSQIDSVLDFILEQGMKPFIDLSVKPKFILHGIGENYLERESNMDDYTVESWEYLMKAFLRHIVNRFGGHTLDEWRMELWFMENWRIAGPEKEWLYLSLFDVTYRTIKACNENIQVGGYGIRMDAGQQRRLNFLRKWKESSSRPDFLTIMYYGYERREDGLDKYARRSTDNEALLHRVQREKALIAQAGFGDLPLILNEWNLTPSVRNFINDTSFKGAYIIKNTLDLYGMVQQMGYAVGSDRQDISFDTNELLFGGGGLLTKDAVMKPAAFAYDFLKRLFPYFIGKDDHMLITTDQHDNYGIVCHNQQELNDNYYLTPEVSMEKEAMWKYYKDRNKLTVCISLDGVTDGVYQIKIYRINDSYGSVMKVWSDMGYEAELFRDDLKYFRRICEPNLTIRKTEAREGNLRIEEQLQPNEIMFIRANYLV